MTKQELDIWSREVAKNLKAASIYDLNRQRELLAEAERVRLKFVELYGLDHESF